MPTATEIQVQKAKELLQNITEFQSKGLGQIYNVVLMTNPSMKGDIFVRFDQSGIMDESIEFHIVQITPKGEIIRIGQEFKNFKERYAFLGECLPFKMEDLQIV